MGISLQLFGQAHVVHDGQATALKPDRRVQLLVVLALRADWVSRDEAAALLWPERNNAEARNNLRKVLHDAAALPWAAGARLQGTALRWSVDTDVAEYQRQLGAGQIEAALDLGAAPLLEGFDHGAVGFADWLAQQRLALAERRRAAVLLALGDPATSTARRLAITRRMLAIDALDEDAVAAELQALVGDGQHAAARHAYERYCERLAEAIGAEPSARLRGLMQPTPTAAAAGEHSPMAFVGRAAELAQLTALVLDPEVRLLTLLGPGGVGKSRLARSALARLEPGMAHGALRVPLDDLPAIDAVAPRVAQLAQLQLSPASNPADQVAAWLASRRMLMLLDNAEHLPELPALLTAWRARASEVKWLVTSRRRLGLPFERVMLLGGMALPQQDTLTDVMASDAGRLFVHRARQAKPNFDLTAAGAAHTQRLLRALGGLPLAIELAAAWVRLLPVGELADEVGSSLQALAQADEGDERPEHRSVQATFDQSWRLLSPAEQRALAALSVFAGEFPRAAALAVTGAGVALLSSLSDKSLLQVRADGAERAASLSLHPLLRQFVRDRLAQATDERRDLSSRHARHYAQWLADAEPVLRGPDQAATLAQIEAQLPDCWAAWQHALSRGDQGFIEQATPSLMYYYEARGRRLEGIALFAQAERALEGQGDAADGALATLARALSTLRFRNGEAALTIDTAQRGIERARRSGARAALKGCLLNLGLAHWQRGHPSIARDFFEEGLALVQADRDLAGIGAFVSSLATVDQMLGDARAAEAHYREALRVNRELNHPRGLVTSLYNLGLLLAEHERHGDALPLFEEGLRLCSDSGIGVMRGNFLFGLGWARFGMGQLSVARELTLQALAAVLETGEPHLAAESQMQLARIAMAAGDAALARHHAHAAVRLAQPLENAPVLLNAICSVAEASAHRGELRDAVALWLFAARHALADAPVRQQAQSRADASALPASDRAWAERRAQGYELVSLALALAKEPSTAA